MKLVNLQNQKHDQACMIKYLYEFTVTVFFPYLVGAWY